MARHETIVAAGTYTTDQSKIITVTEKYDAAHVVVNVGRVSPTSQLDVTLAGYDTTSKKSYTLLTSTVASGLTVLRIDPNLTAGANIAKDHVPYSLSVYIAVSGGVAADFSIGASLM